MSDATLRVIQRWCAIAFMAGVLMHNLAVSAQLKALRVEVAALRGGR